MSPLSKQRSFNILRIVFNLIAANKKKKSGIIVEDKNTNIWTWRYVLISQSDLLLGNNSKYERTLLILNHY